MESRSYNSTNLPSKESSPGKLTWAKAIVGKTVETKKADDILGLLREKFEGLNMARTGKTDGMLMDLAGKLKKLSESKAEIVQLAEKKTEEWRENVPFSWRLVHTRIFDGPLYLTVTSVANDIPADFSSRRSKTAAAVHSPNTEGSAIEVELPDEDSYDLLAYNTGDFYQLVNQEIRNLEQCINEILTRFPEDKRRGKKFLLPILSRMMTKVIEPEVTKSRKEVTIVRSAKVNQAKLVVQSVSPTLNYERLEPFVYKRNRSNVTNSLQVSAGDISAANGQITKQGFLTKRRAMRLKFHLRWVVLRGFKLYWYRKKDSSVAKGMILIPITPVEELKVFKVNCFSLDRGNESKLTFVLDNHSYPWKLLLQNQVAYRSYLEQSPSPINPVTEYFKDCNMTELDIHDTVLTELDMNCMADGMIAHNRLQVLVLERVSLKDTEFCRLIEACLGCTKLETLKAPGNFLTVRAVQGVTGLMKQEDAQWNCLMHIDFSYNPIGDAGVELLYRALIVRFKQLFWPKSIHAVPILTLELEECSLTDLGLHLVCELLTKTNEISNTGESIDPCIKLNLSKNSISSMFVPYLSEILRTYQYVYSLNISGCPLLSEDCTVIAQSIRSNTSLIELDLRSIPIDYEAAIEFFDTCKMNFSLTKLYLTFNPEMYSGLIEKAGEMQNFFLKTCN